MRSKTQTLFIYGHNWQRKAANFHMKETGIDTRFGISALKTMIPSPKQKKTNFLIDVSSQLRLHFWRFVRLFSCGYKISPTSTDGRADMSSESRTLDRNRTNHCMLTLVPGGSGCGGGGPIWSPARPRLISQTHLRCTHTGLTRAHVGTKTY